MMYITLFIIVLLLLYIIIYLCFNFKDRFQTSFDSYIEGKHTTLIKKYKKKLMNNVYSSKFNKLPIYYINLDRSPDRKKFMEDQFKLYNLPFTRIKGVDGKTLNSKKGMIEKNLYYKNNYKVVDWKKNKNMNILGCTLSHLKAIITAYENGDEMALIFEDDTSLALCPFWKENLQEQIKKLPKDWGAFNLATNRKECMQSKQKILPFSKFKCCCCAAYIVNRKGMNDILRDLYTFDDNGGFITLDKTNHRNSSVDHHLISDWFIYNRTNSYTYNDTPLFFQYIIGNKSTIHRKNNKMMKSHRDFQNKQVFNKLSKI